MFRQFIITIDSDDDSERLEQLADELQLEIEDLVNDLETEVESGTTIDLEIS